jgi:RNA polymerase sigma-70 factor (ECF subfamily)
VSEFAEFVGRLRAGDDSAAAEFLRRYGPAIRREVRLRLQGEGLKRLVDSSDVCQSVLASFLFRAAAGQYDLDQPGQLLKLLVAMARNKVASLARKEHAQRRDARRLADDSGHLRLVAGGPSPSRLAAGKELWQEFQQRLSDEERRLAELRAEGLAWADIAGQLGGTPAGRRMQLTRAVGRVAGELGLDDD